MTTDSQDEATRMRHVPGIFFADGPAGRRAVVAGTGLDVWEVIATWHACGGSYELLQQSYPWLTEVQLGSGLAYYEFFPKEIDVRLHLEAQWDAERVRSELLFLLFARPRTS